MDLIYSDKKACDYIDWSLESSYYNKKTGIICLTYHYRQEMGENILIKEIGKKYTEYKKKGYERAKESYTGTYGKMGKYDLVDDLCRQAFTIYEDEEVVEIVSSYDLTNNEKIITIIPQEYLSDKITYKRLSVAIEELAKECKEVYKNYERIIVAKSQFYRYDLEWEAVLPIIKDKFKQIEIKIVVTEK